MFRLFSKRRFCTVTYADGRSETVKTDRGLTARQALWQGIGRATEKLDA